MPILQPAVPTELEFPHNVMERVIPESTGRSAGLTNPLRLTRSSYLLGEAVYSGRHLR